MMDLNIEERADFARYLRQKGHIGAAETPAMDILAGGVSNRTVLVTRTSGEAWVIKQALSKLRVEADWFSSPLRVHREAMGLRRLSELTPPGTVPALIFEDEEAHLIGMQAVPQPHRNWKQLLLEGHLELNHIIQFAQILAAVHQGAWQRRAQFAPEFADRSFFESLRLEPYYQYTADQWPEAAPFLRALIAETRQRSLTLVHGDYSPKNVLIYKGQLVLLDYEVIHWGDPAFDVGFSMTHLLSKAHHLLDRRTAFVEAALAYWQQYAQSAMLVGQPDSSWRKALESFAIRHTLACLAARVLGRSPLEYLSPAERTRQAKAVLKTIAVQPASMAELIQVFMRNLCSMEAGS